MPSSQDNTPPDDRFSKFWGDFHRFPTAWTDWLFKHPRNIYLLLIVTYAIAIGYLVANESGGWKDLYSLMQVHILPLGALFVFWGYFRWLDRIQGVFTWANQRPRISQKNRKEFEDGYFAFLNEYQQSLNSKIHFYLSSFLLLTIIVIFIVILFLTLGKEPYFPSIIPLLLFFCLWAFISGAAVRPAYVTMKYIRLFFKRFQIRLQPSHPDSCGGLEQLGNFCFAASFPLVLAMFTLTIVGLGILVESSLKEFGTFLNIIISPQLAYGALLLETIFVLPVAVLTFFFPLWDIHRYMQAQKRDFQDEYANRIQFYEEQVLSSLGEENGLGRAEKAKEEIVILQVAFESTRKNFPVWPFRPKIVLYLFSPQILSAAVTVIGKLREFLPTNCRNFFYNI